MNKELAIEYILPNKVEEYMEDQLKKADNAYNMLMYPELDMTGWIDYPENISEEMMGNIYEMAKRIRNNFSALVIVGIGGSYLGAHAAFDFINRNGDRDIPKIYYAGIYISTDYHEKLLRDIKDENTALLIISKSGGTTETLVAGNMFMEYIEKKYGKDDMQNRIFIITDPMTGRLRELVNEEGYASLPVPNNIGGRFSVLTPVGLLPMAIAGIDIREMIQGAVSARQEDMTKKAKKMAAVRNTLENIGYSVELFADFDPYLNNFIEWIKQLYGESEGKQGRGMFPVNLEYSMDLHSLGQFVQEGRQIFTETFIGVKDEKNKEEIVIPKSWGISEKDMTMAELNFAAKNGAIAAHSSAGAPIIQIDLPYRNEYSFGQALYFFQMSCAIRGIMMGVNPFDQPGVKKYKEEMKKYLEHH